MLKFCANLSMLYTEHAFLDRFAAAAADGFSGVEYLGPYDFPVADVSDALNAAGLTQVLFNLPAGDWAGGERGIACLPERVDEFRAGVDTSISYAEALGCRQINCLAGIAPDGAEHVALEAVLLDNLAYAAPRLEAAGIRLLLEPINTRDIPGFFVSDVPHGMRLIDSVGHANLWLQYDFYHAQIMSGDLVPTFERLQSRIAHVQIADNPGRHEPGTGEIHHPFIFQSLERLNYDGWIGCEYKPLAGTSEGLGWMAQTGVKE